MLLNCGVGEDSLESLGLLRDPTAKISFRMAVHSKGDQSWVFTGRTDAEAETHGKSCLIGKDPDWGQEEKGTTEDEMVGWHHQLNGHEFE